MTRWIVLTACLAVVTGILTLIWWWVGDLWADDEHKKFGSGASDPNQGATVVRGFDSPEDDPQ